MFWESDCITAKGHSNQCLLHGLPLFPLLNLYQHLILCNWGRSHYQWQAGDNWPFNFCFLLLIWCLAPFQYKTTQHPRVVSLIVYVIHSIKVSFLLFFLLCNMFSHSNGFGDGKQISCYAYERSSRITATAWKGRMYFEKCFWMMYFEQLVNYKY